MLKIIIPSIELFDETLNEFTQSKEQELQLEHSLVSLSKWEAKWCKPFWSVEPIYIPGRRRTGSKPSST